MNRNYDLIVLGGGVIGLSCAYRAGQQGLKVLLLERHRIGWQKASSSGYTRSFRRDYLDALYLNMAEESRKLWNRWETEYGQKLLYSCGCLNLEWKTPSPLNSYARKSRVSLQESGLESKEFGASALSKEFPQFEAEYASLDPYGGVIDVERSMDFLRAQTKKYAVTILEEVQTFKILDSGRSITLETSQGRFKSERMVVACGIWINDVLNCWEKRPIPNMPITASRPLSCEYFVPENAAANFYTVDTMPVFACLDHGIYGHPIFNDRTPGIKIGMFHPPDLTQTPTANLGEFVKECLPGLRGAKRIKVEGVDQGSYEMTPDGDFIVGTLPFCEKVFVIGGLCGTGFKFAPLLAEMALGDIPSALDLKSLRRFDVGRFQIQRHSHSCTS